MTGLGDLPIITSPAWFSGPWLCLGGVRVLFIFPGDGVNIDIKLDRKGEVEVS